MARKQEQRWFQKKLAFTLPQLLGFVVGLVALVSSFTMFLVPKPVVVVTVPTPTPTPSPTPTPASLDVIIVEEMKRLTEGKIAFNPPTEMKQGQPERVEARITSEQIEEQLTDGLKGRGIPQVESIKVGRIMKVFLHAAEDEFQIQKLSSDEQVVAGRPYAQWEWMVTALSFGEHTLHLKATTTLHLERFGEKTIDVPVIDKQIKVRISPLFIVTTTAKNMSWYHILFGGGTLTGGILAIWSRIRRKKKQQAGFRGR